VKLARLSNCYKTSVPDLGPFCFRNSMEDPVNGLHVIFSGTQGTLSGGTITVGPPGRITATDNQISVFLNAQLAPGMPLCFTVWSESEPINISNALWSSDFNVVGTAEEIQPESPPQVTVRR
jgi:hypothetical protein